MTNIKEYKFVISLSALSLILLTTFAFFSMVFPFPATADKFYVLGILGENKTASYYYPNDDSDIRTNYSLNWNIYVQNFMQESKYILVKIKLVTSSAEFPNIMICSPSTAQELMNFTVFLTNTQHSIIPFTWQILNYTSYIDFTTIDEIKINDVQLDIKKYNIEGTAFYFLFELWYYDVDYDEFRFEWKSGAEFYSVWTKMNFRIMEE